MVAFLQHRPGELIEDRYEVLGVLGSGAFGTVYQCRDVELDTVVAIKELHVLDDPQSGVSEREAALAQFRREAVNLSHLHHPHIVSGHYERHPGTWLACPMCGHTFRGAARCPEHGAAPIIVQQRHYLVMEYLSGPDLAEAARHAGGILEIRDALRYIRQTAEALQLIHARDLVHRDIKPENIRLRGTPLAARAAQAVATQGARGAARPDDDAVLLDFGITTQSGEAGNFSTRLHRHTTGGGTPGYAPDSPHERRYPDARSDIHALGMTLYHLVSGRDPQEEMGLRALRTLRPRDFNADISSALETLILKAIDPDPTQRQQNAAAFLQDLLATVPDAAGSAAQASAASGAVASVTAPTNGAGTSAAVATAATASTAVAPAFTFRSGKSARDVAELVRLMDSHRQEATGYLYKGNFATWLRQIGREDLAQRAREICNEYPDRKDQGLEALAQATGLAEPPVLEVEPGHLDFGTVPLDGRKTLLLKLRNVGRGYLFGLLRATHPALKFNDKFEGNRYNVPVTLHTRSLPRGAHRGEIIIDSSAGEMHIPFSAVVRDTSTLAASFTVLLWAILGMLSGWSLRALPLLRQGTGWKWLTPHSELAQPLTSALLVGLVTWGILLLLTLGEATRRKSWSLFLSAASLSLPLALLCAAFGNAILVAGDVVLQPLMGDLAQRWAAGGWMVAGGIAGAIYGTLRRLADVFSARLPYVLLGWLFFVAIMSGVLWIVRIARPG